MPLHRLTLRRDRLHSVAQAAHKAPTNRPKAFERHRFEPLGFHWPGCLEKIEQKSRAVSWPIAVNLAWNLAFARVNRPYVTEARLRLSKFYFPRSHTFILAHFQNSVCLEPRSILGPRCFSIIHVSDIGPVPGLSFWPFHRITSSAKFASDRFSQRSWPAA